MLPRLTFDIDPLLCAAAELFEKRGYDNVSVEMIAVRAGVGRSTAFTRYTSKEGILAGIVEAFMYAFPLYLAQGDASAAGVPGGAIGVGGRPRARRMSTPPPLHSGRLAAALQAAGRPGPARLVAALRAFCGGPLGSLGRIALASKDLPWVRRTLGKDATRFHNIVRLHLGPGATHRLVWNVVIDLLKHAVCDGSNEQPVDEASVVELLALVSERTPGSGSNPPPPPEAPAHHRSG
jgi:AcrR family transcriptional regulator